jgi:hypothetical protein
VNLTPRPPHGALDAGLGLLTAAALVVDAVLHLQLARVYNLAAPGGIGQGNLFRLESAAALLTAALVLAYGGRIAYALAFVIAASATAAALLSRYVDVPAVGPIPAMYEPVWFAKKVIATAAEALGTLTAAAGWAVARTPSRSRPATAASPTPA